jgi:hypothetical protein
VTAQVPHVRAQDSQRVEKLIDRALGQSTRTVDPDRSVRETGERAHETQGRSGFTALHADGVPCRPE